MKHITEKQRYTISVMLTNGHKKTEIASYIGVHKSTIYREVKRNKNQLTDSYEAAKAQSKCERRHERKNKHTVFTQQMQEKVDYLLTEKQYSPEQIVGYYKRQNEAIVSHERIYQYIWEDKRQDGSLYKHLRRNGRRYNKRGSAKGKRGRIKNRTSIEQRPDIVDTRKRFGDFEIDTIIGKGHRGAILTINERKTGIVRIKKLDTKAAHLVQKATRELLQKFKPYIQTMTSDNGKEFAHHEKIAEDLELDFYFAHPYHSWERGSNENLNGLIRQYIPKKTEFNQYSDEDIKEIEYKLNHRPRKRHDYKSPIRVMNETLGHHVAFMS